jgi:hypothetical protein
MFHSYAPPVTTHTGDTGARLSVSTSQRDLNSV